MLQIYFEKLVVNSGKSFALERTEINSKNINTLILFYITFHYFSLSVISCSLVLSLIL